MTIKVYVNACGENDRVEVISESDFEKMVDKHMLSVTADKDAYANFVDGKYAASQILEMDDDEIEAIGDEFKEWYEGEIRADLSFDWVQCVVNNVF